MHEKALQHLTASDRTLARIIAKVGPCRLRVDRKQSPFQALVEAVAHQQLTGKAAQTILGRIKALHPHRPFPTPEDFLATHDDQLRAAGFSRAKVAAVKDISTKILDGIVPTPREMGRMKDADIVERLMTIRGVGQWTVEMLLIFKLGRPDVLPVGDYGVLKGFSLSYRKGVMAKPADLLAHGERWRPFRSVASWYMWRALEWDRSR